MAAMSDRPNPAALLGADIRRRREARQMSQETLARLAGVGRRLVSELERGKPTVQLDVVGRVLAVFGLRVAALPMEVVPERAP
ncbi:MAG: Helix-turn-helix domain [Pseudomonadota bacterium]|jgi:y4mF family transcriptional regulator